MRKVLFTLVALFSFILALPHAGAGIEKQNFSDIYFISELPPVEGQLTVYFPGLIDGEKHIEKFVVINENSCINSLKHECIGIRGSCPGFYRLRTITARTETNGRMHEASRSLVALSQNRRILDLHNSDSLNINRESLARHFEKLCDLKKTGKLDSVV